MNLQGISLTNNTIPSTKDASQSMILWQSDGILLISGTVSVLQ